MAVLPETKHVLLIDRDVTMRQRVATVLLAAGYRVTGFPSPEPAFVSMSHERHDAVIASLDWPPSINAKRVRALKRRAAGAPLMVLCPAERVDLAIRALHHGADDYLLRPPDPFELKARLERILDRSDLDSRIAFFQDELSKKALFKLEARSPTMRTLLDRVLRVAPLKTTALIFGESGVGKELVARSIHFNSPRRDLPFIALNCAAMAPSLIETELFGHEKGSFTGAHARVRGKFEIAHGGTLFLDEIGEMEPNTQAKLLRVLEEREFMRVGGDQSIKVDVRVIAATNADLEEMVQQSRFRRDLYYRLKVVTLRVPPLRERGEDIPHLARTFLDELAKANAVAAKAITPEALEVLRDYPWPGNVRELKNFLESALVSLPGEVIGLDDLPRAMRQARTSTPPPMFSAGTTLAQMECELIRSTLEQTGGNRTHSAALLGIGVRTLQRKMRTYGIRIAPTRRRSRAVSTDERPKSRS